MTSNLVGQDLKNPFYQDTITVISDKCIEEINQANSDFEKGLYVIELAEPIPFTDTQQKILFENYGIETSYSVGLFSPNHDCYNFHLKSLAKEKWKHDIFKKSKSIADSLDKFGHGDQQANFKSRDGDFYNFIKTNLSEKAIKTRYLADFFEQVKIRVFNFNRSNQP